MVSTRRSLVELETEYGEAPAKVREVLSRWTVDDYSSLLTESARYFQGGGEGPFSGLVLRTLRDAGPDVTTLLLRPGVLTVEEARAVFARLAKNDAGYAVSLLAHLREQSAPIGGDGNAEELIRLIDLLPGHVAAEALAPVLAALLKHEAARVRSKAALVFMRLPAAGRMDSNPLRDSDGRVRANALEALWGQRDPETVQAFFDAMEDEHSRVVGNALRGLYEAGIPASVAKIQGMLRHTDPQRQATAFWVAGTTGDTRFLNTLEGLLPAVSGRLRGHVLKAVRAIQERKGEIEAAPALELSVVSASRWPLGRVHCRLVIAKPGAGSAEGEAILPTHVHVHDGDIRVDAFRWTARASDAAHVLLILPRRVGVDDPFAARIIEAADGAIDAKRSQDSWGVSFYQPAWGAMDTEVLEGSAPAFLRSASACKVDGLRSGRSVFPGLQEALHGALRAFPAEAKEKHVVVVRDPLLAGCSIDLSAWKQKALERGLALHVLCARNTCPEEYALWEVIARELGGTAIGSRLDSELAPGLSSLTRALTSCYELTYALARVAPELTDRAFPLRIEIFSPVGRGNVTVPEDGQARHNLLPSTLLAGMGRGVKP